MNGTTHPTGTPISSITGAGPSSTALPYSKSREPQMGEFEALDSSDRTYAVMGRRRQAVEVPAPAETMPARSNARRHRVVQPRSMGMALS